MKREGWLRDPERRWTLKFHLDEDSWIRQQFIFIDQGRAMPGPDPALLKSRKRILRTDAIRLWRKLLKEGWQRVGPQW